MTFLIITASICLIYLIGVVIVWHKVDDGLFAKAVLAILWPLVGIAFAMYYLLIRLLIRMEMGEW